MVDAGEHHDGADPASLVFGKVGYRMLSYYLDLAGVAVAVGRGARGAALCVCVAGVVRCVAVVQAMGIYRWVGVCVAVVRCVAVRVAT